MNIEGIMFIVHHFPIRMYGKGWLKINFMFCNADFFLIAHILHIEKKVGHIFESCGVWEYTLHLLLSTLS